MIKRAATAFFLTCVASATLVAQTPRDGNAVLERMKAAYEGKWYHTPTFGQKTTQIRGDGTVLASTWHESLRHTSATGVQLRIDMGDLADGNGVLYTTDSSWRVQKGALARTSADGNEFLPLIEGVYVQPVSKIAAEVAHMHVDATRTMDISLDGYEAVGPAWLATKISMAVNGKTIQTEEYYDWKTNVDLSPALFDVKTWTTAPHWAKK